MNLEFISTDPNPTLELQFIPKKGSKTSLKAEVKFERFLVKGVTAKGVKMATREVKKIVAVKPGKGS